MARTIEEIIAERKAKSKTAFNDSKSRVTEEEKKRDLVNLGRDQQDLALRTEQMNSFAVDDVSDYHRRDALQNEMSRLEKQNTSQEKKLATRSIVDRVVDEDVRGTGFVDTAKSNLGLGQLQQDNSLAWNRYINDPSLDNKRAAESLDAAMEYYQMKQKESLYTEDAEGNQQQRGNWISKDLAQYLPQLADQIQAQVPAQLGAMAIGAATGGAGYAKAAQVLGGLAAGKQSFDVMRGASYKGLKELGVSEDTALRISRNEALISAMIESAETIFSFSSLGFSDLLKSIGSFGVKKVAQGLAREGMEQAAESSLKKLLSVLKGYGINILTEAGEEAAQEGVAILAEKTAMRNDGLERTATAQEDWQRIAESAAGGAKIAAMMGAPAVAATQIGNRVVQRRSAERIAQNERAIKTAVSADEAKSVGIQAKKQAIVEASTGEIADVFRALGDEGSKAYRDAVISNPKDEEGIRSRMAVAYSTGLSSNKSFDDAKSLLGDGNENELRAFYEAAQKDRVTIEDSTVKTWSEAQSDIRSQRAEFLKTAEAGLLQDTYAEKLNPSVRKSLDLIAKQLGNRIVIAPRVGSDAEGKAVVDADTVEGFADQNGFYDPNTKTIFLNADLDNKTFKTTVHEVTHAIQKQNSKGYQEFKDIVVKAIIDTQGENAFQRYADWAMSNYNVELSVEQAQDEMVANEIAKAFDDPKKFIEKYNSSVPIGRKIVEAIRKTIRKIKNTIATWTGTDAEKAEFIRYQEAMEQAQAKWMEALKGASVQSVSDAKKETITATNANPSPGAVRNTATLSFDDSVNENPEEVKIRFSIRETLKDDLQRVLDGSFDKNSEIYIGETSNFLIKEIGADALRVTMPVNKAYSAMVTKEQAIANKVKYLPSTNYHGLGIDGLIRVLVASENPVAAFAAVADEKGKRTDSIVLVTDEEGKDGNIVVVEKMSKKSILYGHRIEANKVITTYDRAALARDIEQAVIDGRLLYMNKEKSQHILAGGNASNSQSAIREVDFKQNIQHFWDNVKWEKSGKPDFVSGDNRNTKTEVERAFEKAQKRRVDKEKFSLRGTTEDDEFVYSIQLNEYKKTEIPARQYRKGKAQSDINRPVRLAVAVSTNSINEDNSEVNQQFSLRSTAETSKSLIAIHNLTSKNLLDTIQLGGFVAPSIAILKAADGHTDFGEISILFEKSTVDPKKNKANKIYGADAWTPTFPRIVFKLNENLVENINNRIEKSLPINVRREFANTVSLPNMTDKLNNRDGNFVEAFKDSELFKMLFAAESGDPIEPVMKSKTYGNWSAESIEYFMKVVPEEYWGYSLGYDDYKRIEPILRKAANEEHARVTKRTNKLLYEIAIPYNSASNLVSSIYDYNRQKIKQVIDTYATRSKINETINQEEFELWLAELGEGIIEKKGIRNNADPFTRSGNRKKWEFLHEEVNAKNILKNMFAQEDTGISMFQGPKQFAAVASKEYKSISDVKNDSNRLVKMSEEERKELVDEMARKYYDVITDLANDEESQKDDEVFADPYIGEAVVDAIRSSKNKAQITNRLKRYSKLNVTDEIVDRIIQLAKEFAEIPTIYFEAKPRRVVDFAEIKAAVIPENTDKRVVSFFERNNIKTITYRTDDDADRIEKTNSLDEVKFSLRDSEGKSLTEAQAEYFKDSKVRDKDGNLLRVYHGTDSDFTTFGNQNDRKVNKPFYFTVSKEYAQEFANRRKYTPKNIIEAYLDIHNPFDLTSIYEGRNPSVYKQGTKELTNEMRKIAKALDFSERYINDVFIDGYDTNSLIFRLVNTEEFSLALQEKGYDGIKTFEAGQDAFAALNPSQIKSIDNLNPTESDDIRFMLRNSDELVKENRLLKKDNDLLKKRYELYRKQIKLSRIKPDMEKVEAFGKKFLKLQSSDMDITDFSKAAYDIFESIYFANKGKGDPAAQEYAEILANELAKEVMSFYNEKMSFENEEVKEIRTMLRNIRIIPTDIAKEDLDPIKRKYRRIKWAKPEESSKPNVFDLFTAYEMFAERFPDIFDADEDQPQEMLNRIITASEAVQTMTGSSGNDFTDYIPDVAMQILEAYDDVVELEAVLNERQKRIQQIQSERNKAQEALKLAMEEADRQKIRYAKEQVREREIELKQALKDERNRVLAEAKKQGQAEADEELKVKIQQIEDRAKQIIEKEKLKAEARILREKKRQQERVLEERQKRKNSNNIAIQNFLKSVERTSVRKTIHQRIDKLNKMAFDPTDKAHMPSDMEQAVVDFTRIIRPMAKGTKPTENDLKRLVEIAAYIQGLDNEDNGETHLIDVDLADNLIELSKILKTKTFAFDPKGQKKENSMNLFELQVLNDALAGMSQYIKMRNQLFTDVKNSDIYKTSQAISDELSYETVMENGKLVKKPIDGYSRFESGLLQAPRDMVSTDMLAPLDFAERLGSTFQEVFQKGIRDGMDRKIELLKRAEEYMLDLIGDEKVEEWSGPKAKLIEQFGLRMTVAQWMSLYVTVRQDQAVEHIVYGGIVPTDYVVKGSSPVAIGKVQRGYEPVQLSEAQISQIVEGDMLTEAQKRIALGVSDFFMSEVAEWGNEVSMKMYDYRKFTEENYFPIVSDGNFVSEEIGKMLDRTLRNMGSTKKRIRGAKNPIRMEDIFDVFSNHVDKYSSYNAFVPALSDLQRIYNQQVSQGTVKLAIAKRYGDRMQQYYKKLIVDINGGMRTELEAAPATWLASKYKSAVIGMNLRVIVQQPTSLVRASAMIDPKYLAKGMMGKVDWELVKTYAPIAQWKDWGYFTLDVGRQLRNVFLGKENITDKMMAGVGAADRFAWLRLWRAVEIETTDLRPDLEAGSEEFFRYVGARFSEIIDRTQVVDTVLHRTGIMRAGVWSKMITSFMSEPLKSYNLLNTAIRNFKSNRTTENAAKVKRTFAAWAATVAVTGIARALMDMWRDEDEPEEGFFKEFFEKWLNNVKYEPLEMFPYLRDWLSSMQGYSVERLDAQLIEKAWRAFSRLDDGKYTLAARLYNMASVIFEAAGIPVSSATREISDLMWNTLNFFDGYEAQYSVMNMQYDVRNQANAARYIDQLFEAHREGDMNAYNNIMRSLIENGYTASKIDDGMRSRYKKAGNAPPEFQSKTNTSSTAPETSKVTVESLKPAEAIKYLDNYSSVTNELMDRIKKTDIYRTGNDVLRAKIENAVFDYAKSNSLSIASNGRYVEDSSWINNAKQAIEDGIGLPQYIALLEGRKEYGASIGASGVTQEETEDYLDAQRLKREEKAALWAIFYPKSLNPFK